MLAAQTHPSVARSIALSGLSRGRPIGNGSPGTWATTIAWRGSSPGFAPTAPTWWPRKRSDPQSHRVGQTVTGQNNQLRNCPAKRASPPPNTIPDICRFAPPSPNIAISPPMTIATSASERASGPVKVSARLLAARSHGACARATTGRSKTMAKVATAARRSGRKSAAHKTSSRQVRSVLNTSRRMAQLAKSEPVPALAGELSRALGARRSARLRTVVRDTGLPPEVLLDLALKLVEIASRKLSPPPLKRTAITGLGTARWRNVSSKERSEILRRAVQARWAKHRRRRDRGSK